jgi:hypothetical protein
VINFPDAFMSRIQTFMPMVQAFDEYKSELLEVQSLPDTVQAIIELGFKKLALHQMGIHVKRDTS